MTYFLKDMYYTLLISVCNLIMRYRNRPGKMFMWAVLTRSNMLYKQNKGLNTYFSLLLALILTPLLLMAQDLPAKYKGSIPGPDTVAPNQNKKQGSVTLLDGYTQVDGRLYVDPVSAAKYFEVVATSTPTAVTNKAFLWLHVNDAGTLYTLKVTFGDGTTKNIATGP